MKQLIWGVLLCVCGLIPANAQESLRIVTTTTQASDLVRVLTEGIDTISVTQLMNAGVDPHLYQPTEADIRAMSQADMIVYSGLHLEGRFDTIFESLSQQGVIVFSLGEQVKAQGFTLNAENDEALGENPPPLPDPHFWFDPRNWQLVTLALSQELAQLDPQHATLYDKNATRYAKQLEDLFGWAYESMQSVPAEQRFLVTSHDAFRYFGDSMGWQVNAIQGISTADEVGVGDVQSIVSFVIDNAVPVIFVESSVSQDTIEAVQEAVLARGAQVGTGQQELYSDAMGEESTFGETYLGMFIHNVLTILQAYEAQGVTITIAPYPSTLPSVPDYFSELFNE